MSTPIRVLHLEDSPRDAELIRCLLESEGVVCDIVRTDNRRAFEAALQQDGFDIILTDNNLPDYDGTSALKAVQAQQPLTPVIVISGSLGEEDAVKCLQFGATDYLLKVRLERLVPAFRRALTEAKNRQRREAAEAELRQNEERMRLALTATNDAIWDWDLVQGRMVCNPTFVRLFGEPPEAADLRAWWYERTHPEDRDAIQAGVSAAIAAANEFWAASHRLRRVDSSWAHVQNRACLSKNAAGEITRLIGAVQDVTAHVEAENERRELGEQLRQAQKMEAIGTLAGGIAHDFNNILGIILANVDLAKRDIPADLPQRPEITESLQEILVAANRARDLVRQILTFSRHGGGKRQLIQPQPIVRECVKLLRTTIPAMTRINEFVDPSCPAILADPTQLHQVVMNICTNAWHALPERGGLIEVSVRACEPTKVLLEANPDLDSSRYVRISITDNGHGMDLKTQARIFEPFFTTKSSDKGTGLGLAVVHGIVKAHGGAITVRSGRGQGTTFDVYLPAQSATVPAELAIILSIARGKGERIVVVDDDSSMGRAMQRQLKQQGYLVQAFHRPELALEVLRGAPHDYDLVITDYSMPDMTGIEFAGRVMQLRPDIPIILVTGSIDFEEEKRAQLTAFHAVLAKPVLPEILFEAVADAVKAKRGGTSP
jgi:PAS domain S-box-containing protein